jgi:hypothetical protein
MGHSTTVYRRVSEYSAERFIEHPHWGQSRRIESVMRAVLRRGGQLDIAHATKKPDAGGTASATADSTTSMNSDVPP